MDTNPLADIKQEGTDPFADLEKDTPPASPTEKEPKVEEPKEGDNTPDKDVPFHKHPRWIEREEELKTLRERDEERAKEVAELTAFKEETSRRLAPTDSPPDWFKELYGDNPLAWQKYHEHDQVQREEIKQEVLQEQQLASQQAAAEAQKWNKWVDDEIGKLQTEGHQFDRNELIKTMLEYRPTDEQNNFDFQAGFRIYEALKGKEDPAKSQARKELADTTTRASKGEPKAKDYMTPKDLRYKSWANL